MGSDLEATDNVKSEIVQRTQAKDHRLLRQYVGSANTHKNQCAGLYNHKNCFELNTTEHVCRLFECR